MDFRPVSLSYEEGTAKEVTIMEKLLEHCASGLLR